MKNIYVFHEIHIYREKYIEIYIQKYIEYIWNIYFKISSSSKQPEGRFAANCLWGIRGPKNLETVLKNLFSLLSAEYLWEDKKEEHKEKQAPLSLQKIPYLVIMGATK